MPLDPQIATLLDQLAEAGGKPVGEATVAEVRAAGWDWIAIAGPGEAVARVEDRFIPGPTADLAIRIYTPAGTGPFPGIVAFHGSGWVVNNLDMADAPHRELANRSGCVVVAVNYQKAPEHQFPVPLDDCTAAAAWVVANAATLDIDPDRVGLCGDSAGGNLAIGVSLRARNAGGPRFAFQVLIYPATDYRNALPSMVENAEGYLLTATAVNWFWDQYLTGPEDGANPLASPLRHPDLTRLPPAVVVTAEYDPVRDQGEAYADRLAAAGVPVIQRRYDGATHAFFWMGGHVDASHGLIADLGRDVRAMLAERC